MNSGPRLAVGALGRDVQRAQTIFVMIKTLGFDQMPVRSAPTSGMP